MRLGVPTLSIQILYCLQRLAYSCATCRCCAEAKVLGFFFFCRMNSKAGSIRNSSCYSVMMTGHCCPCKQRFHKNKTFLSQKNVPIIFPADGAVLCGVVLSHSVECCWNSCLKCRFHPPRPFARGNSRLLYQIVTKPQC